MRGGSGAGPDRASPVEHPLVGGRLTYFSGFRNPVILLALKVSMADTLAAWKFQWRETGLNAQER